MNNADHQTKFADQKLNWQSKVNETTLENMTMAMQSAGGGEDWTSSSSQAGMVAGAARAADTTEWMCDACTYLNQPMFLSCEMCGLNRHRPTNGTNSSTHQQTKENDKNRANQQDLVYEAQLYEAKCSVVPPAAAARGGGGEGSTCSAASSAASNSKAEIVKITVRPMDGQEGGAEGGGVHIPSSDQAAGGEKKTSWWKKNKAAKRWRVRVSLRFGNSSKLLAIPADFQLHKHDKKVTATVALGNNKNSESKTLIITVENLPKEKRINASAVIVNDCQKGEAIVVAKEVSSG